MLTSLSSFRVIAVREKLSDLKQHIELLIQSMMIPQTAAEVPTVPSTGSKLNTSKVPLDKKAKVCKFKWFEKYL